MKKSYTKRQISETIKHWQRRLKFMDEKSKSFPTAKYARSIKESLFGASDTVKKIAGAIESGAGVDEIRTILQQAGYIAYPHNAPHKKPRQKNATGQWYVVYSSDTASESEYGRIAAGELTSPDEIQQDNDSTAYGPFPTAYDANLYWWKEYGRDYVGEDQSIEDFDTECAENGIDPDLPRDSDWIDNGDSDMRDWCQYRYEVVAGKDLAWYKKNRSLSFAKP